MEFDEYVVDLNADCPCGCMDGDRFHNIYRFPNDFGASVVSIPRNEAEKYGGFRVMLIRFEHFEAEHLWKIDDDNPLFATIFDRNNWSDVLMCLRRIYELPTDGAN
jgi:hypothetical protein